MAKKPSLIKSLSRRLFKFSIGLLKFLGQVLFMLLPTIIFIYLLQTGTIEIPGPYPVVRHSQQDNIHELIPNTKWQHLKPCGTLFKEAAEFETALQCVNNKVWPDSPVDIFTLPPRCFIVSVESPDVFGMKDFNFIPIISIFGSGGVVGFYQPESMTVYIIENVDAALVYRHELQHFFLHLHDPITRGGGHFQDIWKQCEPPYYTPSERTKIVGALMNDEPFKNSESQ